MQRALATIGTGPAKSLLELALPTFVDYAARHDYELVIGSGDSGERPPAWGKICLIRRLLERYDFVLWLDSDTLILDASVDVETVVPDSAFQAFVIACREVDQTPNTGVWALRSVPDARRFLEQVWEQSDLVDHWLWEQAAVMRLLGWNLKPPFTKERATEWDSGTFALDEEWDMLPHHPIGYGPGRIRHYSRPASDRRRRFDMATDLAGIQGRHFRHRLGLVERWSRPLHRWLLRPVRSNRNVTK